MTNQTMEKTLLLWIETAKSSRDKQKEGTTFYEYFDGQINAWKLALRMIQGKFDHD